MSMFLLPLPCLPLSSIGIACVSVYISLQIVTCYVCLSPNSCTLCSLTSSLFLFKCHLPSTFSALLVFLSRASHDLTLQCIFVWHVFSIWPISMLTPHNWDVFLFSLVISLASGTIWSSVRSILGLTHKEMRQFKLKSLTFIFSQ